MKIKSRSVRILIVLLAGLLSAATLAVLILAGVYLYFSPQLPNSSDVGKTRLNEPLRIYTADHKLIGEFGTERRIPLEFDRIPEQQVQAFVAAEDEHFWKHSGVDYHGLTRAGINLLTTGRKTQGGSTITMQLARNLYLSGERTYSRKIKEVLLAMRLESELSKEQLMELYLNRIYLGHRSYGVGAAAKVYYDKKLDELNLAQYAMLAGLPKAPSTFNPIANPKRSKQRRNYVLNRMYKLGFIDKSAWEKAKQAPITAGQHSGQKNPARFEARYVAEMVRQDMVARFGDKAYTGGYRVVTTIDSKRQRAANQALRKGLRGYDSRHGWRGAETTLDESVVDDDEARQEALDDMHTYGGLVPAVVLSTHGQDMELATAEAGDITVEGAQNPWLHDHAQASSLATRGDVVRLARKSGDDSWTLAQKPDIEGAMVAMNPHTGGIEALAGGFDYGMSSYNRAVQSRRQTGSAFKPFLYSAALDNGFNAASIVNDAPIVYRAPGLSKAWRPRNFSGRVHGPTRLREGLVHSRNLVSIRVLRSIGIKPAIDHMNQFGLPKDQMPHNLSLALGTAAYSPLQMAGAFSVLANNGFRVKPHYISRIDDGEGETVFTANPRVACEQKDGCQALDQVDSGDDDPRLAPRVIDAGNAYIIGDMMRDVIRRGTGRGALRLGRKDLAGKTGTTNDMVDAWFPGFNANLVAVVWTGFDQLKPMGKRETGARMALPIWTDFMGKALSGTPEAVPPKPDSVKTIDIDPQSGERALSGGIPELFMKDHVPSKTRAREPDSGGHSSSDDVQDLF